MRYLAATLFVTALGVAPAAMAAPNSINDCEKIEAADAYNRCLASFGPVAHTHGGLAKDFGGDGDAGAGAGGADVVQAADPETSVPKERRSAHGGHHHGHWTRHYHHYAHYHGHGHGHSSAHGSHSGRKRLAFNVTSHHRSR